MVIYAFRLFGQKNDSIIEQGGLAKDQNITNFCWLPSLTKTLCKIRNVSGRLLTICKNKCLAKIELVEFAKFCQFLSLSALKPMVIVRNQWADPAAADITLCANSDFYLENWVSTLK